MIRRLSLLTLSLLLLAITSVHAWQQRVHYTMRITLEPANHSYTGSQRLVYTNNSPDTIREVYYHLFYEAFKPGSMMDQRDSTLPDSYLGIRRLDQSEQGVVAVQSLAQEGTTLRWKVEETTLHATLAHPIPPGGSTTLDMEWITQIPRLTRRGGWLSSEGIEYSMAQWYPKLAEYDRAGWHNDEYVSREFYGVFGTFDVDITLPGRYIVGATGTLQNPQEVGCGYELGAVDTTILYPATGEGTKTWRFHADDVHDFAWTADPDYVHQIARANGVTIHALYARDLADLWRDVGPWSRAIMAYFSKRFGPYLWPSFTVAQGGDGGMEYPMLIMITGNRTPVSLAGVIAHEMGHQWYYGMMANNEIEEAWMDEGFAQYLTAEARRDLFGLGEPRTNPYQGLERIVYPWTPRPWAHAEAFYNLAENGYDEPLSTWHDHFREGATAGTVYYSGETTLRMLQSMVGDSLFDDGMQRYHAAWHFRHPSMRDFERSMEEATGLRLDWFFHQWILNTTRRVDYAVDNVESSRDGDGYTTRLAMSRRDDGLMGFDVTLRYEDGSSTTAHVSPEIWTKPGVEFNLPRWTWMQRNYSAVFRTPKRVVRAEIDTALKMLDIDRTNNSAGTGLFADAPPVDIDLYRRWDIERPWDRYTIRARPTPWYSERDGVQLGATFDGGYTWQRYEATLGAAYNVRSKRVDCTIGYSSTAPLLGRLARYRLLATNADGVQHWSAELTKAIPNEFSFERTLHEFRLGTARDVLVGPNYPNPVAPWWSGGWNTLSLGYRYRFDQARPQARHLDATFRTSFDSPTSFTQWTVAAGTTFSTIGLSIIPDLFLGVSRGAPPAQEMFAAAGARGSEMHANVVHRLAMNAAPGFMARNHLVLPTEGYLLSLAALPADQRLYGSVLNARMAIGNLNPLASTRVPLLSALDIRAYGAAGWLFPGTLTFNGFGEPSWEAGASASIDLLAALLPTVLNFAIDAPRPLRLSLHVPFLASSPLLSAPHLAWRWAIGVSM